MAAQASVLQEGEYSSLKDFKLEINRDEDSETFSLCFWIYLSNKSPIFPSTIIRQMRTGREGDIPFLILNKEKKMTLFPLLLPHEETPLSENSTSTKTDFPIEKWVHVGCEVSTNCTRLHIDGVVVGEKTPSPSLNNDSSSEDFKLILAGSDGDKRRLQGFVYYVHILPPASYISDHFVKNPPIYLTVDNSCISEIEEGEDGVWTIVGGKASCRRNFSMDITLLDAFGHPVKKEMEVVASLLYADNGAPVEKPDDAESPLLTFYDGIEFSSSARPSKLLHGRASFKLRISQLSSKCDNRLFRVRFDSPKVGKYPFLETYSNHIRCISRGRGARIAATSLQLKSSATTIHLLDEPQPLGTHGTSPEAQHNDGDKHFATLTAQDSVPAPPPKRFKVGAENSSLRGQADPTLVCLDESRSSDYGLNTNQGDIMCGVSVESKPENLEGTNDTLSDSESVQARYPALKKLQISISDLTIFKFCLGGIYDRSLLLKDVAMSASDQEINNLAHQVSLYTGCSHHKYQISMTKRLIQEGTSTWTLISHSNQQVLWENAVVEIEEQFMKISRCNTKSLTGQDLELLRRIAGCGNYMNQENFEILWRWLYPVALTLSNDSINAIWCCSSPRWIEGFITKGEAEFSLKGTRGLQEPGTFILRFPTSRCWPHPDAGSLVVTYISSDYTIRHRMLSLDYSCGNSEMNRRSLRDLLLAEPHLTRLGRVTREFGNLA